MLLLMSIVGTLMVYLLLPSGPSGTGSGPSVVTFLRSWFTWLLAKLLISQNCPVDMATQENTAVDPALMFTDVGT